MDSIVVMVIDKQALLRAGVREVLSRESDFTVVESAPSDDLLNVIEARSPDVLLVDIDFPSLSGLELSRNIKLYYPGVKMIVLSPNFDNDELFETIKTGAVAYLDKNTTVEELIGIIKQAYHGEYPINDSLLSRPKVAERVLRQFQETVSIGKPIETITAHLTSRETQVLKYIAEGNTNKQIAQILETSEQTVKNQVSSILRKLNANDRTHAIVLAIRRGWISAEKGPA